MVEEKLENPLLIYRDPKLYKATLYDKDLVFQSCLMIVFQFMTIIIKHLRLQSN